MINDKTCIKDGIPKTFSKPAMRKVNKQVPKGVSFFSLMECKSTMFTHDVL